MKSVINSDAPAYSPDQISLYQEQFFQDGFLRIPRVLAPEETQALRTAVDRVFNEDKWKHNGNRYSDFIGVRLFETDRVFEGMLAREPIIGLIESILGPDCHLIAQNIVRNAPGQAIDTFHVDDALLFPVGPGMERHDPRLHMPVFICTVQIPLTDIPTIEHGPSQYIPGSHYSGRKPDDLYAPNFEGREPVSVLCDAGDIYLHNGQCWHRGAPNVSDRMRYLLQLSYGMRWVSQRFYPFVNYQMPQEILDRADDRRKRILGIHPKGAYG